MGYFLGLSGIIKSINRTEDLKLTTRMTKFSENTIKKFNLPLEQKIILIGFLEASPL